MRRQLTVLGLAFGTFEAALGRHAQGVATSALELARIKQGVKSKRVSSYDVSGGNADHLGKIADGARRELFNVKGAGIINHIWVTIAPPPPALSRHDIILRMYWDGETDAERRSAHRRLLRPGLGRELSVRGPAAAPPGRARDAPWSATSRCRSRKGARIEIENDSAKTIDAFYYYVDYERAGQPCPRTSAASTPGTTTHSTEAQPRRRERVVAARAPAKNTTGDRQLPDRRHRGARATTSA